MRKRVGIVAALAGLSLAGCQFFQQPSPRESTASVLDVRAVRPPESRFAQPVQVVAPDEPAITGGNEPLATVTPSINLARGVERKPPSPQVAKASDKSSYKVKKGDTLYRIAKTEYGDGKKWTLIASANPGLSPQSLKSGATIVIP